MHTTLSITCTTVCTTKVSEVKHIVQSFEKKLQVYKKIKISSLQAGARTSWHMMTWWSRLRHRRRLILRSSMVTQWSWLRRLIPRSSMGCSMVTQWSWLRRLIAWSCCAMLNRLWCPVIWSFYSTLVSLLSTWFHNIMNSIPASCIWRGHWSTHISSWWLYKLWLFLSPVLITGRASCLPSPVLWLLWLHMITVVLFRTDTRRIRHPSPFDSTPTINKHDITSHYLEKSLQLYFWIFQSKINRF